MSFFIEEKTVYKTKYYEYSLSTGKSLSVVFCEVITLFKSFEVLEIEDSFVSIFSIVLFEFSLILVNFLDFFLGHGVDGSVMVSI